MHLCVLLVCTCHDTTLVTVWSRVKEPFGTCTGTRTPAARARERRCNRRLQLITDAKLLQQLQRITARYSCPRMSF